MSSPASSPSSSRASSIALVAIFAAFLCTPAVAWLAGVEGAGVTLENRTLAKRPPLSVEKVLDASWGKAFSDWVWDTIPLRDKLLTANHRFDYYVLHDSPTPTTLILGSNGFAYARERVVGQKAGAVDKDKLLAAIAEVEKAFDDAGVRVIFAISPNKETLYPEYLPARYRAEHAAHVGPVVAALRERAKTDHALLDQWSVFEAEKRRLAASPPADKRLATLWRAKDQHWNVEAGRLQIHNIVDAIDASLWSDAAAPSFTGTFVDLESEMSTIYMKTGATEPYQAVVTSPFVALHQKDITFSKGKITNTFTCEKASGAPADMRAPSPLHVAVIRDSFLSAGKDPAPARDGGMQTLASFFASTTFVHWDSLTENDAKAIAEMSDADVVVVQLTQGNLIYLTRFRPKLLAVARGLKAAHAAPSTMIGPQPQPPPQ